MDRNTYDSIRMALAEVVKGTEWEGHVYLVGGCVRDEVMKGTVKDIDLAVDLPDGGIRFAGWLQKGGHTATDVVTYPGYGTAMFRLAGHPDIELEAVQTRKEKYLDGKSRNPVTAFGTLLDDCFRRDLTINALYCNVSTGEVLDPTGKGLEDIRNQLIRTTTDPDVVYDDDPLRILRCIRFAARFGWQIDDGTWQGMLRHVDRLSIITPERIRDEVVKMLTCRYPARAMQMLAESGAMRFVIPELEQTYDMGQNRYHFGSVWEHTLKVVEELHSDNPMLMMAGLLHDIGKITTRTVSPEGKVHFIGHEHESARLVGQILKRLKFSNDFIHEVQLMVDNHMQTKPWKDDLSMMKDKHLRKMQYLATSPERLELWLQLIDADNRSHAEGFCMYRQADLIRQHSKQLVDDGTALFTYRPPLSGDEIMQITGTGPGKHIRDYQLRLLKWTIKKPLRSRREWVTLVKGLTINKTE